MKLAHTTACYAAWIASSAVGLWLVLHLRINLIDIGMWLEASPWIFGAVDKFGTILLGLGWLIAVFLAEMYLRGGLNAGQLYRRIGRVVVLEAVVAAASLGLQWGLD
ncbi:MAG: hypothetical protein R3A44_18195 [Caldilineaceae bacterium]